MHLSAHGVCLLHRRLGIISVEATLKAVRVTAMRVVVGHCPRDQVPDFTHYAPLVAAPVGLHKHARHVHASRAHSYAVLGRALLRRLEGFEQVHHIAHFPKVIVQLPPTRTTKLAPRSPASGPLGPSTSLPSWAAVAVGLRAGLPRLLLIGEPSGVLVVIRQPQPDLRHVG